MTDTTTVRAEQVWMCVPCGVQAMPVRGEVHCEECGRRYDDQGHQISDEEAS